MFLEKLSMESITPCIAYPEKIKIIARSFTPLGAIIPYLAAYLKGSARKIFYNKETSTLMFTLNKQRYTIYSDKIAITTLETIEEARNCLSWIQQQINDTNKMMQEIIPLKESTKILTPLNLFPLMPGINCKKCGEKTCLAFASKLSKERIALSCCPILKEKLFREKYKKIINILQNAGHELL